MRVGLLTNSFLAGWEGAKEAGLSLDPSKGRAKELPRVLQPSGSIPGLAKHVHHHLTQVCCYPQLIMLCKSVFVLSHELKGFCSCCFQQRSFKIQPKIMYIICLDEKIHVMCQCVRAHTHAHSSDDCTILHKYIDMTSVKFRCVLLEL